MKKRDGARGSEGERRREIELCVLKSIVGVKEPMHSSDRRGTWRVSVCVCACVYVYVCACVCG